MDAKQYEAGRRELARREFVARDMLRPVLRCDMLALRNVEGEYLCPKVGNILNPMGESWGISAQDKDGSAYVHLYRDIPAALLKVAGVAVERPTRAKYEELLPPYSDSTFGHFSRAHTAVHYVYPFTTDYNPLQTDSANWTKLSGTTYLKASSGKCDIVTLSDFDCWYQNAAVGTMGVADYSLAADFVKPQQDNANTAFVLLMRFLFASDYLNLRYYGNTTGNDFKIYRRKAGGTVTELGAVNVSGNNTAILQAVGTQIEAFWGGVSQIDVADTGAPTSAYTTGLYTVNNAAQSGILDNFAVYIAAVSSRRRRLIAS